MLAMWLKAPEPTSGSDPVRRFSLRVRGSAWNFAASVDNIGWGDETPRRRVR